MWICIYNWHRKYFLDKPNQSLFYGFPIFSESPVESVAASMQEAGQQNQAAAAAVAVSESIEDLSSGKLLFIIRGLPGSGKTTKAM